MALIAEDLAETIQRCRASRTARQERYRWLRLWYTRGTDLAGRAARYNRLESHIDLLTSYLYAPDSTRFAVTLPPDTRARWLGHLDVARDEFLRQWRTCGADVRFSQFVEWACVYATVIAKVLPGPGGRVELGFVDPGAFGVLREDLPTLDGQEAFVHWFVVSLPEFERLVRGLPDAERLCALARQQAIPGQDAGTGEPFPRMIQQVVVTSVAGGTLTGNVELGALGQDRPEIEEPLVELMEVWQQREYDQRDPDTTELTRFLDWKVSTVLGDELLMERRNPVLPWRRDGWPAEQPFVAIVPHPYPDYFWGRSEVSGLVQLQAWRESRMQDIDELLKRQLDPPAFFSGVALSDEKLAKLRQIGGYASTPQPNAKMQPLKPEMPPAAFELVGQIDQMFNEYAGIPEVLAGGAGGGQDLRAGAQISAMANIAVGRIRKKALLVEDALEVLATRMFHLMQRNDPTQYRTDAGQHFVLGQIPAATTVKVSAHSSSPVYAEQVLEKAMILLKAGAIDLPTFVELVDPPMLEALKEKAKGLQEAQAAAAKEESRLKELQVTRPARR